MIMNILRKVVFLHPGCHLPTLSRRGVTPHSMGKDEMTICCEQQKLQNICTYGYFIYGALRENITTQTRLF